MAHAHDASNNNPKKEVLQALIGIALLLTIIAGIGISAWLRPAGNHEPATVSATKAGQKLDDLYQKQTAPAETQQAETVATATAASVATDAAASSAAATDKAVASADGTASATQSASDAKTGK